MRSPGLARSLNLAAKVALIGLLLYAVARPDLPQFQGKAMDARLYTFGSTTLLVPVAWFFARTRTRATGLAYPDALDACLVLPFLLDAAGNALDLYDSVVWFDDAMHFLTWIPLVVAFGLALHYAPPLPRWAHWAIVVGLGAVSHICWELLEYVTFIRDNPAEFETAYTDTLGDLLLSLCGSITGATLVVTVLWSAGRRLAGPRNT